MTAAPESPDDTALECEALTRYLVGSRPSAYVLECYRRLRPSAAVPGGATVDRALDSAVRLGAFPARVADAYARFFRPTGSLRRRLTLMLAILENAPDSYDRIGAGTRGSYPGVAARVGLAMATSGVALLLGLLIFGPIHLATGGRRASLPDRSP